MLSYLPVAKLSAQLAAGLGVSKIVADIVKNNVAIVTTVDKIAVRAGSFVLGSILIEQSSNHIERVAATAAEWLGDRSNNSNTDPNSNL